MNTVEFCYWLNGYFELSGSKKLTEEQVKVVKEHLDLVFEKVTKKTVPEGTILKSFDTGGLTLMC